tara:strand:- start:694 stop:1821 length:1128 start_codon:yes stop_codon:yes gene_type:complete
MKNKIYKYFFNEFIRYFSITIFALAVIIWTVQSVNFLDLVTEDGHALGTYFSYSLLTISKILTKLVPFSFFVAMIWTIVKFEKDNELIIIWSSGLNKIYIVNLIFKISLLVTLIQLILTNIINPTLLLSSRILLKNSELKFIPSLLKEKQFNDTVEGLTIFVESKDESNFYKNIFIRDDSKILSSIGNKSSTIFSKSGYIDENNNLILFNGNIQKLNEDNTINVVKFKKTTLNLSGLSTKSISDPKMQETPTLAILECIKNKNINLKMHNCSPTKKSFADTKIEINKRFGIPIFIPLLSLICSFLLFSRRDKKIYKYNGYIYSFLCFSLLATSEIMVRYSGISWTHTTLYYSFPLIMIPIIYFTLIRKFKYENLT